MKHAATLSCLLLLGILLGRAFSGPGGVGARYHCRISDPAGGRIQVTAEFEGFSGSLELVGLLEDQRLGVDGLRAEDGAGRPVPITAESPGVAGPSGSQSFTRYRLRPAGRAERLRVSYSVRPSPYRPPNGDGEVRGLGVVTASGCALALPNLVLVPSTGLASAAFDVELPAAWDAVALPPATLAGSPDDSLWREVLVAGEYERIASASTPDVRLSLPAGVDERVPDAVRRIAEATERLFGPPAAPLHVIATPFEPGGLTTELVGSVEPLVVDLRAPDPGSLRRLVRMLLPRWFGRTPIDVELDESRESWFALGLQGYLAQRIPAELGLVERDLAASAEWTWMRSPELRELDLEAPTDRSPRTQIRRRMGSVALVHELAEVLGVPSFEALLRRFDGRRLPEFPPGDPRGELLDTFLETRLRERPRRLSFEADWTAELSTSPAGRRSDARIADVLTIAFTADTWGYLEGCGCKLGQAGGVAHRADALRELRAEREVVVLDLGNFAPTDAQRPFLDPIVAEELRVYLALMQATGCDAACVGPDELYAGVDFLRSPPSPGPALVGAGVRVRGREAFPDHVVISRGGKRIGFVGYSELLEHGPLRQAQERNMLDVSFPRSPAVLVERLRELRGRVDLLVVGGRFRPASLRRLCEPDLGVDLVLLGGYPGAGAFGGRTVGFLGGTAVALDQLGFYGFNELTLYLDAAGRVVGLENAARDLHSEGPQDADTRRFLDRFYAELGSRPEVLAAIEPLFPSDPWQRDDYVGAAACQDCHPAEFEQWRATEHARAIDDLKRVRRDRHPKCVRCHVVGLGTETGYQMTAPSPRFAGVQCELCHGAGGAHVRDPATANVRRVPPAGVCLECHDAENSPDFPARFHQALERVRH